MRITLVCSSLDCGGAERVVTLLSQGFLSKGHEVCVVTLSSKEDDFYTLPSKVNRLALNLRNNSQNIFQAIKNNLSRLRKLKQAIISTEPDIVISHLVSTNILVTLSMIQTKYPVILTEHNNPKMISKGKLWKLLRRLIYPYASKIVSVSDGLKNSFQWISESKLITIYNPFLLPENKDSNNENSITIDTKKKTIVSMGRLTEQKGFDILLSAFAKVAPYYPDWQLLILGKGDEKQFLEKLKDDLGLCEQAFFIGTVKDPSVILEKAQLFVMSSRYEAFPMAHGEAMACGLPVIATDCPFGPREIIRHEIDGILVSNEDISELADKMSLLMSDDEKRNRLAAKATEVVERFSLEKIIDNWEQLILEVII
ncbi:MAG: glycosyltransferase family 4 protein [Cyanobacteria bacterium P01_A01_bin.45]